MHTDQAIGGSISRALGTTLGVDFWFYQCYNITLHTKQEQEMTGNILVDVFGFLILALVIITVIAPGRID
jgi:hypothetical protein